MTDKELTRKIYEGRIDELHRRLDLALDHGNHATARDLSKQITSWENLYEGVFKRKYMHEESEVERR